jgi:muramidase (phage lysozyme)
MARIQVEHAVGENIVAFLDMLSVSEGTFGHGDDGYNMLVNPGGFFSSYAGHPHKLITVNPNLKSTAAGRYQINWPTWLDISAKIKLHDFTPLSQDIAAIQLIKRAGAYVLIVNGKFDEALAACAKTWASLPGAGYGQHENSYTSMKTAYLKAGGSII